MKIAVLILFLVTARPCHCIWEYAASNSNITCPLELEALRYLAQAALAKVLIPGQKGITDDKLKKALKCDRSDCVKRLICELNTRTNLSWDEQLLANVVSDPNGIYNYNSATELLKYAVAVGKNLTPVPRPEKCTGEDDDCCTKATPCGEGEGDCDTDKDCAEGYYCGKDNCKPPTIPGADFDETDDCCVKIPERTTAMQKRDKCTGEDDCCTPSNPCGDGEGDCDNDEDCKEGHVCGKDNCKPSLIPGADFDETDDCCLKKQESIAGMPPLSIPDLNIPRPTGIDKREAQNQCEETYSRCRCRPEDAIQLLRKRGISLDLDEKSDDTQETCSVLFIWGSRKARRPRLFEETSELPRM